MPAKRKSAAQDRRKSAKASKPDSLSAAVSASASAKAASTHEKPVPVVPTYADSWPNGLASWPAVLRAVAFQSFLKQESAEAWSAAISVARRKPADGIDLSLLTPQMHSISAHRLWFNRYQSEALKIQMYDVIERFVVNDTATDDYMVTVIKDRYLHSIGRCNISGGMNCVYCTSNPKRPTSLRCERRERQTAYAALCSQWNKSEPPVAATYAAVPPDELYNALNSSNPNPLFTAITLRRTDLLIELL